MEPEKSNQEAGEHGQDGLVGKDHDQERAEVTDTEASDMETTKTEMTDKEKAPLSVDEDSPEMAGVSPGAFGATGEGGSE